MKNHFPFFALLLLFGCQRYYYIPNTPYVPALDQRHDTHVRGGVSFLSGYRGLELQTAYSPFKNTGVLLNYMHSRWGDGANYADTSSLPGIGHFVELGLGHQLTFGANQQFAFSAYGGYGLGFLRNNFFVDGTDVSGAPLGKRNYTAVLRHNRFYIQPAITFKQGVFRATILYRFCHMNYYYGSIDYNVPDQEELNAIRRIEATSPIFMREYGIQLGIVKKPVSVTYNFTFVNPPADVHFAKSNLSVTLGFDLNELWKK
jgi:hypothetical protein